MRSFLLLCAASALLLSSSCKSGCRQLTEKLCDCAPTTADRNACLTQAASVDANTPTSNEDNAVCSELYPQCDCRLIDTAQGKVRCGLARNPNASGQ